MTVYDGVMAVIVLYTVVHGYFRGAAWQVAPILSLVMGYMVAMPMSVTMAHYFGPPPLNRLFALVTIYLLVSMIVYLMIRTFREGVEKAKLTEFDRHLGAIMGGVKGILLTLAVTCVLLIYFPQMRDVILKSESSSIAAKLISTVYPILPKAMHTILDPYLKQLDQQLPIDLNGTGYPDSGTLGLPQSAPVPATPGSSPSTSPPAWRLEPTSAAETEDPAPPVRRQQIRSAPPLLDPTDAYQPPTAPQTPPRRQAMRSAQEDDPFEAADPDRAISPPR